MNSSYAPPIALSFISSSLTTDKDGKKVVIETYYSPEIEYDGIAPTPPKIHRVYSAKVNKLTIFSGLLFLIGILGGVAVSSDSALLGSSIVLCALGFSWALLPRRMRWYVKGELLRTEDSNS